MKGTERAGMVIIPVFDKGGKTQKGPEADASGPYYA